MSVGDSFTLVPLSNFFVKKSQAFDPAAHPNISSTFPIASGRIETDGTVVTGGATGNFTWYRLSHYEGATGTQAKEFREYLLILREVSATSSIVSFKLNIPDGGFTPGYFAYRSLYDQTYATTSGVGTHAWIISFPNDQKFNWILTLVVVVILTMKVSSSMSWAFKHPCVIHACLIFFLSLR
jgi:hypothetical protein